MLWRFSGLRQTKAERSVRKMAKLPARLERRELTLQISRSDDKTRRDRQSGFFECLGDPSIAGPKRAKFPAGRIEAAVRKKTGRGLGALFGGRPGNGRRDVADQPIIRLHVEAELGDLGAAIESVDAAGESDDVQDAAARPERRLYRRQNTGLRIGKIVFVAPTKLYEFRLRKVRQFWNRIQSNFAPP